MPYRGHIDKGAVILEDAIELPDGTAVTIEVVETTPRRHHPEVERFTGILPKVKAASSEYKEHLADKQLT